MLVHDWEIWHTYSSYLRTPDLDLERVALRLVESGVAYLAMHRDGFTVWRNGQNICTGQTHVGFPSDASAGTYEIRRDDEKTTCDLTDFPLEVWSHACQFRLAELRLFGSELPLPEPYVRAFLGQCNLRNEGEDSGISIYPVLILYKTGVVTVEFRTICPEHPVELSDFIRGDVNLFASRFEVAEVPPGLSRIAPRAWSRSSPRSRVHQRVALLRAEQAHDRAVTQLTSEYDAGDFHFDLAPLSNDATDSESLSSLALTIIHCTGYLISHSPEGWRFVLRADSSIPEVGDFWSGRPYIHLVRFQGQRNTASENHMAHADSFALIITRAPKMRARTARTYLPESARPFEDYAAYITPQLSLWVWSKEGVCRKKSWADANRGHLVYENQALAEMLEYGYMLHRRLFRDAHEYIKRGEISSAQRDLVRLEQYLSEASPFGEIRDLLTGAWTGMGLDGMRRRIREALEIQGSQAAVFESRRVEQVGRLLTLVFGIAAIPALALDVLKPAWRVLGMPRPQSEDLFDLMLISTSLLFVLGLVWLVVRPLAKFRSR